MPISNPLRWQWRQQCQVMSGQQVSGTAGLIENAKIHEKQSLPNLCTGMFSGAIIHCNVRIFIDRNDLITYFK